MDLMMYEFFLPYKQNFLQITKNKIFEYYQNRFFFHQKNPMEPSHKEMFQLIHFYLSQILENYALISPLISFSTPKLIKLHFLLINHRQAFPLIFFHTNFPSPQSSPSYCTIRMYVRKT